MDEGFKCPVEAGGGYYGSRATEETEGEVKRAEQEEEDEGNGAGVLPYRLRVGCRCLWC